MKAVFNAVRSATIVILAFNSAAAFNPSTFGAHSPSAKSTWLDKWPLAGVHDSAVSMQRVWPVRLEAVETSLQDFAVSGGPVIVKAEGYQKVHAVESARSSGSPGDSERLKAARRMLEVSVSHDSTQDGNKPILLYLPGIELTGYSVHRQIPELSTDFEVQYLATSPEDRTGFDALVDLVRRHIETETSRTSRRTYLVGESFGGVLALAVALRGAAPPSGLAGLALINPATSVTSSWPSNLQPLLDAVSALPPGLSDATYAALATPILMAISGDPLQLSGRFEDDKLSPPLRLSASLRRLADSFGLLAELPSALPLPTLAFRLSMLVQAAKDAEELQLDKLKLPVQVFASSEDNVLPSVREGRRLARALPNADLTILSDSGHVPLLEVRVRLADLLRQARLTEREAVGRKDYVADFHLPSAEEFANASASLRPIRQLTSPVFFSTDSAGQRIPGLRGLPPMANKLQSPHRKIQGEMNESVESMPPVLFVGNHQLYGVLDLPLLVEEIHQQTGVLVRALAHPVVFSGNRNRSSNRGEGGGFVNYEQFGAVPVSGRALCKLLSRGESALLYPGGVREAFKSTKRNENYKLFWPPASEGSDFAGVAARFGATIVPVAAIGAEEGVQMLLDADELLNIPFLGERLTESTKNAPVGRPGERFVAPLSLPSVPGRYYFLFGRPIDTRGVNAKDKEACTALYASVQEELEATLGYLLDKRKEDPWEPVLPRAAVEAASNWTWKAPSFKI